MVSPALIVEDGSGLSTADAFVSLADADTYFTAYDGALWNGSDEQKKTAIRRATAWLSTAFVWQGTKTHGRSQALAWPRAGIVDREGWGITSDEIPFEIKEATYRAALYEHDNPFGLTPEIVAGGVVKREKVDVIEIEYAIGSEGGGSKVPSLTAINNLIAQYVVSGGAGMLSTVLRRG